MTVKWLSYEMERNDIHIQHVRNGGEKRVGKYSLDGYCEEYHTAYEFQGCFWHGKRCNVMNADFEKKLILFSLHRLPGLLYQRNSKLRER